MFLCLGNSMPRTDTLELLFTRFTEVINRVSDAQLRVELALLANEYRALNKKLVKEVEKKCRTKMLKQP